jgi:hypothetical protein
MTIVKRILVLAALSVTGVALLAPLAARSAAPPPPVELGDQLLPPGPVPAVIGERSLLSARSGLGDLRPSTAEAFEPEALPTPGSVVNEATIVTIATPPPTPAPRPAVAPAPRRTPTYSGDSVWDDLARCESGGNWSINTGNGYYGGLQFSYGTWHDYGGGEFADYPHQASKAEQIVVAERLRAVRGYQPWPACRLKLGLP